MDPVRVTAVVAAFLKSLKRPALQHTPGLLRQSVTRAQALIYLSAYTNPLQPITSYYR